MASITRSQVSPRDDDNEKKRTQEPDNSSSNGKRMKQKEDGPDVEDEDDVKKKDRKCAIDIHWDNEEEAIAELQYNFGLSKEYSTALLKLGQSLKKDDPGVFLTFGSGVEVRQALLSQRMAGPGQPPIVIQGRPGDPGANGNEALQNVKTWVRQQLPHDKEDLIEEVGDRAFAIGNLTQDQYNDLTLTLGFTVNPGSVWGLANAVSGNSLGGILGVTGTGVGTATFAKLPSNGFCDLLKDHSD
jgi:hypothetical protein